MDKEEYKRILRLLRHLLILKSIKELSIGFRAMGVAMTGTSKAMEKFAATYKQFIKDIE